MKRFVTVSLAVIVGSWTNAYAQERPPFELIEAQAVQTAVAATALNADGSLEEPDRSTARQDATPPPPPAHTGFAALAHETWNDFKAFPQRQSTWVILGVGGAASLAVHPADQAIAQHLSESTASKAFWAPGKYIGGVGML